MLQPTTNKNSAINYQAKMFQLKSLKEHPNADNLVIAEVNHSPVVVSKDTVIGDWYVYFPPESQIDQGFLSFTNSFRNQNLNDDKFVKGFFDDSGRVKTIKLRGVYSSGYIAPLKHLEEYFGEPIVKKEDYFDTIRDTRLVKKYFIKADYTKPPQSRSDKKSSKLNVIEGQFKFHNDTENLRRSIYMLFPDSPIEVSYKLHGTSAIVSNLLFQKPKRWYHKLLRIEPKTYYDYVWSSRKVIKNKATDQGYYSEDIWTILKEDIKHKIPEGYSLYGEIVGYLPNGEMIQKGYDYGVQKGSYDFYVYRVTETSPQGIVEELSLPEIKAFCLKYGLKTPELYFKGPVIKHYEMLAEKYDNENHKNTMLNALSINRTTEDLDVFRDEYLLMLEKEYNEKNCYMCKTKVPEEGIVLRVLNTPTKFEAYKLKSFNFLARETKSFDKGEINIEDNN